MKRALLVALAACGSPDSPRTTPSPPPAAPPGAPPADAPIVIEPLPPVATPSEPGEVWLRGSTHVHAAPSGDSSTPVHDVIHWYETHGYDFIVLTDHNKVTDVDGNTQGKVYVHAPEHGLIVLAGSELTYNRKHCEPPGDASGNCRIHVNAIGATGRPPSKLVWPAQNGKQRIELYTEAFDVAHNIGASLIQINHPQYYWGMTPDVLAAIAPKAQLLEIANAQFAPWNVGDAEHPSVEALWDSVLAKGITLWGVASDDAHDYDEHRHEKYPPGGGWVVVRARRDPQAIVAALVQGHFYASNGVTLTHAEREGNDLVVEVAPGTQNQYAIVFIEDGKTVETVNGLTAKRAVPQTGYIRAVVTRDDGKQAWVQPVRR